MTESLTSHSITITGSGQSNRVEFSLQFDAGGPPETVALSVIIPPVHEQPLKDVYKLATLRAIEILQKSLPK